MNVWSCCDTNRNCFCVITGICSGPTVVEGQRLNAPSLTAPLNLGGKLSQQTSTVQLV